MGASASLQQPLEEPPVEPVESRYGVSPEAQRGFYGQPASTLEPTAPPPTGSYGLFMNTLTAFVPEQHVGRLVTYMAVFGVLFAIIGLVGLIFPFLFALAVEQVIGSLMIVGGIFSIVQYAVMFDVPGNSAFLLLGFLHLGFGLWMLLQPVEAGIMLIFIVSGWLFGHGLLKSLMACQVRNLASWPFVLLSGILSVLLALLILVLAPKYGVVLLGIIFGVDFFVSGLSMVLIAAATYFYRKPPTGARSATDPLIPPSRVQADR